MRPAAFSFAPEFAVRGASVVAFDRVRVTLSRTTGVAFDTVVAFPSDSDSLHLVISTPIDGASETLSLTLAMIDAAGDTVFRGGPVPIVLRAVAGGGGSVAVPVRYTGIGANAKGMVVTPLAASVFFGDSVTLTAQALDSSGVPIPGTPIAWRSLDTAVARVRFDTAGRVIGGITRGVARIEASLPTGQADTAQVTVQPVPAALSIASGNAQTGAVGAPLAQPLVVKVKAADSLPVQGVVVTWAVAGGGGSLSKAVDTTDATGSAATAWTLGTPLGSQSVTATVAGTGITATLGATGIAGAAAKLAFQAQPSNVVANATMVPPVQVVAQDTFGNTATSFTGNVTLAIGTNPGSATLGGTLTVAATAGVATFSGLTLSQAGTGYTLVASATGLTSATSSTFNATIGAAAQLAFAQQPSSASSGAAITPAVTVQVRDASGNVVPTATTAVTIAIGTNPSGGTLSGTTTVSAVSGVATFAALSIDKAGAGYTLTSTATGLTGATSSAFSIGAGAATTQAFTTEPPPSTTAGTAFGVTVTARDAAGNTATGFAGNVTVAITSGTGKAGAALRGTVTVAAVAGVATFSGLSIDSVATGYTLTATAAGLPSATSATVNILAASASGLVFTTEPPASTTAGAAFGLAVTARDSLGNTATGFTGPVTVALTSGTGKTGASLHGTTTVNAVAGVATFSGLSIDSTSTGYTITASGTGLVSATSSTIAVAAGPAAALAFTTQPPASVVAQSPFGFTVTAKDGGGNTATTFTGPVTVAIGTNPASGTLSGTLTVNAAAGVATFSGLSIDNIGTGYTLTASSAGLSTATSTPFNVTAPLGVNAWINGAGGNWSVATNWSKGAVPVATDTVTITQSGTYTVNLDVNGTFARIVAGAPSGTQTLAVAANTLTVGAGGGTLAANTVLGLSGTGTITGAGTLTLGGPFNWTGGNLGGISGAGGTLKVLAGAPAAIAPTANVTLQGYTLELDGASSWTGTASVNTGSGGVLRVGAGGVLTVSGDPTISYNLGGAAPDFDDLGTIIRTTSANSFVVNAPVSGTGAWNVQTGSVNLQYGGTVSGPVTVSSGATLNFFTGAGALTLDATSSVTGAGSVNFGGGTVTLAGTYSVTGPTLVTAGTATFNTAAGSATSLAVSGGTLSGTGLLTVSGAMAWSSGNIGAAAAGGTTRVLSGGTLSIAPTAAATFQGYTLELDGTGTWTGTQTVSSGSGAVLRVASGGALTISGDPTFASNLGGATPAFDVLGTVNRSTSANPAVIGVAFNDSGTVNVQSGTLRLTGGGTGTGSLSISTGATLDLNAGTLALGATSSLTGTGTLLASGGTTTASGTLNVTTMNVAGGELDYNGTSASTGSLNLASGGQGGSGLLLVTGALNWAGGNFSGTGTTRVPVGGTLTIGGTGARSIQNHTLDLAGTGAWSGSDTISTGSGAVLRVSSGGTLSITGNSAILNNLGGASPLFDDSGAVAESLATGVFTVQAPFNLTGTVTQKAGVLNLAGGGTLAGPVTQSAGGVLLLSAGTTTLVNKFAVSGGGVGLTEITGGTVSGLAATDTAFFDNLTLGGGTLALSGGTIKTPYELIWSGPTAVSGGTLFVPGSAGFTASFASGTPSLVNATLLIQGSGGWSATTPLSSGSGAVIRVQGPNANLSVSGAGGGYLYNLGGTASLLDNQGTLIAAVSPGSPGAFTVSAQVANSGSGGIQVNGDTLRLTGGFSGTFPGIIGVTNGSTLELGGGTFTLASPLNLGGNLIVSSGLLVPSGKPVGVAGTLATQGAGALQLTLATDSVSVGGSAVFSGGAGTLSAGVLDVGGNFVQNTSAAAFAPTGTFRTALNGSGVQNVSFANPTTSHFRELELTAIAHGVVIQTNVQVTDSLTMFGGGGAATLTGAGLNQRLTVGGLLTMQASTATPHLAPPVLELSQTPSVASVPGVFSPDTTVYLGSISALPTGAGFSYLNVRVGTNGAFASRGGVTYNGDLIVSSGTYTMNTGTDSVGGFFRTEGTGALSMQIANAPNLAVRDSAVFAGGPSTNMVIGSLRVYGNFVERGTGGQFAPTGTRVVLQKGTAGVQTIQFADSVGSFFHDLVLNRPIVDTVRLLSNVQVQDSAIVQGSSVLASTTTEALKVPATGVLRVHSQATLRPFRAEAGTWVLDSTSLGGSAVRIAPDTAVILNGSTFSQGSANQISSSPSPVMGWKSVRLEGGTLPSGGTTMNGGLIVEGTGRYVASGFGATDSINGFLLTNGGGQLQMAFVQAPPTVVVRDSAVFAGGSEVDLLTAGNLEIGGNFIQRGAAPTSFAALSGHTTTFNGTGAQSVNFANPDSSATGAQFGTLQVANSSAAGITLATKVFTLGQLVTADTFTTRILHGSNNDLSVHGLHAWALTLDNVPLVVDSGAGGISSFGSNTWTNMNGAATQFWLRYPSGPASTFTFPGLTFSQTLTTGLYVHLTTTGVPSTPPLTVNLTGTTPASSLVNLATQTLGDGILTPILSWLP